MIVCYVYEESQFPFGLITQKLTAVSPRYSRAPRTNPQHRDIIDAGGEFNEPNSQYRKRPNRANDMGTPAVFAEQSRCGGGAG